MLKEKILNGEELSREELRSIIWEDTEEDIEIIDIKHSDARRWSIYVYCILKVEDRYFQIWYDKGLTEMQPDEYESMVAIEMEPYEIVIKKWRTKK